MPAGRPEAQIDWDQFDKLCELQCTVREIASWFKVDPQTIYRHCERKHNMSFTEYFELKRGPGLVALRRKQMDVAMKGNAKMLMWLGKQYLDQEEKMNADDREMLSVMKRVRELAPHEVLEIKQMIADEVKTIEVQASSNEAHEVLKEEANPDVRNEQDQILE